MRFSVNRNVVVFGLFGFILISLVLNIVESYIPGVTHYFNLLMLAAVGSMATDPFCALRTGIPNN